MIKASVQGLDSAQQSVINLQSGLDDLSPLMDWIGRYLSNDTVERFHTQTDPEGVEWAELRESTVERKKRKPGRGDGTKILVDTGDFMDSITYVSDANSAFIYSSDSNQDKVYKAQFGDANTPARAVYGLSNKNADDIENQSLIWIEGLL